MEKMTPIEMGSAKYYMADDKGDPVGTDDFFSLYFGDMQACYTPGKSGRQLWRGGELLDLESADITPTERKTAESFFAFCERVKGSGDLASIPRGRWCSVRGASWLREKKSKASCVKRIPLIGAAVEWIVKCIQHWRTESGEQEKK